MEPGVAVGVFLGALVVVSLIPAFIAKSKNRSFLVWWLFGLFLFVPALICAVLIGPNERVSARRFVTCQFCRRNSASWSNMCLHCGRSLRDLEPAPVPSTVTARADATRDHLHELGRLGDLHKQGLLTDAEYNTAKQSLLDRI